MRKEAVRKVLIFDEGDPVSGQLLGKAIELFGSGGGAPEYVMAKACDAGAALDGMEKAVREEKPELVLIGATSLGEEIGSALGIRFRTGVAAHCSDIRVNDEGRLAFMVPAFGGKVIGEIFIPGACGERPAVATVKPGVFADMDAAAAEVAAASRRICVTGQEGDVRSGFRLTDVRKRESSAGDIGKADVILCGGFGLGSSENREKLEILADRLGGAVGCTRAALDAGWGFEEDSMIGTSGRSVKPKVYVGFGISGSAHHTCGIRDAGVIININNDKDAEAFAASDYKGVFEAEAVIDALLEETED